MIKQQLQQYFNFSEFRAGQEEVVESILAGNDAVVLMPTGGGKSLCFQLPAVINTSITIVISPLIALMKDQVDSLKLRGIGASYINSSQTMNEINDTLDAIRGGAVKILYIAPERLKSYNFLQMFAELAVGFVAVDEAHCVSSWGHDFRPDYMLIKDFIMQFKQRPVVAAFTATATPEVRDDIVNHLNLKNPKVFVRGFDRPNLRFIVQDNLPDKERNAAALAVVQSSPGCGIVYALTRKRTEEIAAFFSSRGVKAAAYHAGMNTEVRTRVQEDFMENRVKVIVATIAFGMGVNKADVRFVVHVGMPASLENYYQEAGRAGRDGEPADCVLLASRKDIGTQSYFIERSREEMQEQKKDPVEINRIVNIKFRKLDKMREYVDARVCRRKIILQYFADADVKKYNGNCQGCDVCLGLTPKAAVTLSEKNLGLSRRRRNRFEFVKRDGGRPGWHRREMSAEGFVNPEIDPAGRQIEASDRFDDRFSDDELAMDFDDMPHSPLEDKDKVLSETILRTVELYQQGHKATAIAKLRELGVSTIVSHLIKWYAAGGELKISDFVTPDEEKLILAASVGAPEVGYLSSIKAKLPATISYEQIKLALAKVKRVKI